MRPNTRGCAFKGRGENMLRKENLSSPLPVLSQFSSRYQVFSFLFTHVTSRTRHSVFGIYFFNGISI